MKNKKPIKDGKLFPLLPNSKQPDGKRAPKGNKSAAAVDFIEGNYGINLDDQFIVVDFDTDHPERKEYEAKLNKTWTQKTGRPDADGKHHLYRIPPGYKGVGKRVIYGKDGGKIADVKALGYIVGPGSVVDGNPYRVTVDMDPAPAQDWLLDFAKARPKEEIEPGEVRSGIPNGEHDSYLIALAGWLRRQGLSEDTIALVLHKGPLKALQDVDPERPYTVDDLKRIARSAGKYEAGSPDLALLAADIEQGVDFDFPILDWYIHEFIPRGGYLVTGYAAGGTGKSSFGHKLAALVTSRGDNFMVLNHEDTPQYWKACAVIAGADRSRLFNPQNPLAFKTPRDVEHMEKWILDNDIKVVWLDSIKDHFDTMESDAATHTRNALSPLASLASRLGVLIVGIFHTTKKGQYSGSTEMLNVARHVLEFERKQDQALTCRVTKTNLRQPEYALVMPAEEQEIIDPTDPEKKYQERLEDGTIVTRKAWVVQDIIKDKQAYKDMIKNQQAKEDWERIEPLHQSGMSVRAIADKLEIPKSTVQDRITMFKPMEVLLDDV